MTTPLKCACCGTYAGKFKQHPNQDAGYGVCQSCVDWLTTEKGYSMEEVERLYGKKDVNWGEYFYRQ